MKRTGLERRMAHQAALDEAWEEYLAKLTRLASIEQCGSYWPADVEGGTRCDLLEGHQGDHRHKPRGMSVGALTW